MVNESDQEPLGGRFNPWPCSVGYRSGIARSCGVGCRCGSDPELLWLWRRLEATAPIRPLAWEPPYAVGGGPRNGKKTEKKMHPLKKMEMPKKRTKKKFKKNGSEIHRAKLTILKLTNSVAFSTFTMLYNDLIPKNFYHRKRKVSTQLLLPTPPHPAFGNHHADFCLYRFLYRWFFLSFVLSLAE